VTLSMVSVLCYLCEVFMVFFYVHRLLLPGICAFYIVCVKRGSKLADPSLFKSSSELHSSLTLVSNVSTCIKFIS
jgi:hypothetical protein